jgi:hypothetical protein
MTATAGSASLSSAAGVPPSSSLASSSTLSVRRTGGGGGSHYRFTSSTSRSTTRSFNLERPPVILELGSTVVRVGYAEQSQPQHLIRLEGSPLFGDDDDDSNYSKYNYSNLGTNKATNATRSSSSRTESDWYSKLAPLMERVYDCLMCKPSSRRVVCLYQRPYAPQAFRDAVDRHLWNRGVRALVRLDTIQVVPIALGFRRGLVVQVSREETVCVCHADGYVLPYTCQIVPGGYRDHLVLAARTAARSSGGTGSSGPPATSTSASALHPTTLLLPSREALASTKLVEGLPKLLSDAEDPHSLTGALLACLLGCPRDLRSDVVSNIIFCGDGVALLPDLPRLVVQRVRRVLEETGTTTIATAAAPAPATESSDVGSDPTTTPPPPLSSTSTTSPSAGGGGGTVIPAPSRPPAAREGLSLSPPSPSSVVVLARVPLDVGSLRPLARGVALTSCAPFRPDWIAWVGASLWAATWNRYDDDETPIPWVANPNSNNNPGGPA